jgi:hypothetical protein
MDRRTWLCAACAGVATALLAGGAAAHAYVTTDIVNWDLTESVSTYGGGTQFHISSAGDGWASYRWLDSTNKTTVVSGNACSDYALLGGARSIPAGNTAYHSLFRGATYQCFVLRGRTAAGSGGLFNHDGRVRR